eukprot:1195154-Prorocentrum_minimum.AAC.2
MERPFSPLKPRLKLPVGAINRTYLSTTLGTLHRSHQPKEPRVNDQMCTGAASPKEPRVTDQMCTGATSQRNQE